MNKDVDPTVNNSFIIQVKTKIMETVFCWE